MNSPPLVKMCGITRREDAELAVELGAWALGMIFYPASPRSCEPEQARAIVRTLRRRVEVCAVFVNAPLAEVTGLVEEIGFSYVQLHGDEGPAFCAEVARRTGAHIIKAGQVGGPGDVRDLERFHVDYHLLDARGHSPQQRGGTGETFDWNLIAGRHSAVPLILSGGLHAANVAAAIAATRPQAVDTASGTESSPGVKDPERMRAFMAAVAAPGHPDSQPAGAPQSSLGAPGTLAPLSLTAPLASGGATGSGP